jgi:iron complex outermembrane recepter protein
MKHSLLLSFIFFIFQLVGQSSTISGVVKDKLSNEGIPGAFVWIDKNKTVTDDFGKYQLINVPFGNQKMVVAAFDMDTLEIPLKVNAVSIIVNPSLKGGIEFEEVIVTANIATDRVTPIAITRITSEQIAQELGSRDLPMLLNATPGVYATQTGGGDGDARINVRGFDQRNIGVMIDGVPVNDMENGQVYWSNWFGLDAITSQVQVQRGLGATKLSMPSVGGSMNIVTQGIGGRKGGTIKQEFSTGGFFRSSLTYNTGLMKNGTGLTVSYSYKRGNGWVGGLNTEGQFFYGKFQKKTKKHLISLSAFAAPQSHGQRSFFQPIQFWDSTEAVKQDLEFIPGVDINRGIRYNQHWGYRTINGANEVLSERRNFYNKPQITLKDFWTVNNKLSISNIAYVSIGKGGGTRLSNTGAIIYNDSTGQIDWKAIIKGNQVNELFGTPNIDPIYSSTEIKSSQVLLASYNNHFWIGYLPQFSYKHNSALTMSGGLDYRFYKGGHYQQIEDLLGGDYFVSNVNSNVISPMMRVGDKIALNKFNGHRDGLVQWAGIFGSAEYVSSRWTAFVNLSGAINSYKGIDYFQKKIIDLGDTILRVGASDTLIYNGISYTNSSKEAEYYQTDWKSIPGGTFKAGASYIFNEFANLYINLGYLNRTPLFSNVIDNNTNEFFEAIKNEIIQAVELGYTYSKKRFGINLNGYFTNWKNKPIPFGVTIPDPNDPTNTVQVNINGMDAIHMGAEVDLGYDFTNKLSSEFMFSIGDWKWNSTGTFYLPEFNYNFTYDAKGVHVGDAAQTMMNASLKYEPFKNFYIKAQYQWFDRYFANFSPFSLQGNNGGRDSWKLPSYGLMNVFVGYSRKTSPFGWFVNGSITNLLNSKYMADANNNGVGGVYQNFDAQSATVMFGQGLRFNIAVGINF